MPEKEFPVINATRWTDAGFAVVTVESDKMPYESFEARVDIFNPAQFKGTAKVVGIGRGKDNVNRWKLTLQATGNSAPPNRDTPQIKPGDTLRTL